MQPACKLRAAQRVGRTEAAGDGLIIHHYAAGVGPSARPATPPLLL